MIFAISFIWPVASTFLKKSFILTSFPVAIVLGMSTIWMGIIFLYHGEGQKHLRRILGGCFILWGLHKMDYMVLRNVSWFAPWGYIISAGFSLLITITFIFIYFEKARNELLAAQKTLSASEKRMRTIIENQVDKSLSRNNEGSGIGLSLVKSLVELHGGLVSVESIYGEGSEFIIKLPVQKLPDDSVDERLEMLSVRKTDIEFSDIYKE